MLLSASSCSPLQGCVVRVLVGEQNKARTYRMCLIGGFQKGTEVYKFGKIRTSKQLVCKFGNMVRPFKMDYISNRYLCLLQSYFVFFVLILVLARCKGPAHQFIWEPFQGLSQTNSLRSSQTGASFERSNVCTATPSPLPKLCTSDAFS